MPIIKNQEVRGQVSITFSEAPDSGLTVSGKSFVVARLKLASFQFQCFFYFHTHFFDIGPVFKGDAQPIEKKSIRFPDANFMLNLLNKKLFKNNHYSRSLLDLET